MLARSVCTLLALLLATLPLSAATLTVTNTNDSGPGSLRQALLDAEPGTRIEFAIGSGPQTIRPLTTLPAVEGVVIDARTQPGYSGTPIVELDGSLIPGLTWSPASPTGLTLTDADVSGLVINKYGIAVVMRGGRIHNCFIGTDMSGMAGKLNVVGIRVWGGSSEATIGGSEPGDGNLVSGNVTGIEAGSHVSIQGNTFGSDLTQTAAIGGLRQTHIGTGASLYGMTGVSTDVAIGGTAPNVFLAGSFGVSVIDGANVRIIGNYFGTTPSGTNLPIRFPISVSYSRDNLIQENLIAGNHRGIEIWSHAGNRITGNSITNNGSCGIDLITWTSSGSCASRNDFHDRDSGPNNVLNYPNLRVPTVNGNETIFKGWLDMGPAQYAYRIEIFASPACNASGYGEGRDLIDAFDVTTMSDGWASFSRSLPTLPVGTVVTATTTSGRDGTSEFSPCLFISPGKFQFQTEQYFPSTEGATLQVIVNRVEGAIGAASVVYGFSGGTATAEDFVASGGTLHFAHGETTKTFTLQTIRDDFYEGNETIVIALTDASNGATLGSPSTLTVTLFDATPPPDVTLESVQLKEGNAGTTVAEVPILLGEPLLVPYTTYYHLHSGTAVYGSDYIADSNYSVTFAPGETRKSIRVRIVGDTVYEPDESFSISVGCCAPSSTATITILNDDHPPMVSMPELHVTEGSGRRTVTATLVADSRVSGTVAVTLLAGTAQPGKDFEVRSQSLDFADQWSTQFEIAIRGDDEPEPDEQFFVSLRSMSPGIATGSESVVTIVNDDPGVHPLEQWIRPGATAAFTVLLGQTTVQDTTITIASSGQATVSVPATLVIPAGQSSAGFQVTALAAGQSDEIFVQFPASFGGMTRTVYAHTYTPATLRFSPARPNIVEGQSAIVSVWLDPPSTTAATIGLRSSDRVSVPTSLTIPPGETASFVVTPKKAGAFTIDAQLPPEKGNEIQSLSGDVITHTPPPVILGATPSSGPTSGGTHVTIQGANLRSGCSITFGGTPATSGTFLSASSLRSTTPQHAAGMVDVLLTCGSGTFTLRDGFHYVYDAPHVSSVRPPDGWTAGGTHVRVHGMNFDGSCWLFFGHRAATNVVVRDAESATGITPANAAGAIDVSVRCSGGTSTAPVAFTYRDESDPVALIADVVPSAAAPGEFVTIRGANFHPTDRAAMDTTPAAIVDPSPESHVIRVPELSAGGASVSLSDILGRMTTRAALFSVLEAQRPHITAVSPASVSAAAELELIGDGFRPGYAFEIGGHAATIVAGDYTRATVRVPAEVEAGLYPVNVRDLDGAIVMVGPPVRIVEDAMLVASVDPRCTTTDGGVYATIRGQAFTPAATVAFNGSPSTEVLFLDATSLRAKVPPGVAGIARISVTGGAATGATLTNAFRYVSPFDPDGCGGRPRVIRH